VLTRAEDVLRFWFDETTPRQWFAQDARFDRTVEERFRAVHAKAVACELWTWRTSPEGRLAEIIVLDQFSRNLFRQDARAFAADPLALALAQEAVARGELESLAPPRGAFLIMPYMHSESLAVHEEALRLFARPGLESNLEFERRHQAIIARFGRFPHRNRALGRTSTPEELAFLQQPGSSF
jgi:uncharacterized protein (DUF924 family)